MTENGHIVCVFAHPDDEAYAVAGTLAHCIDRGARATIVSATRGEAGFDVRGAVPPGPALARRRSDELAESCDAIGAQPPVFLDLPDGRLSMVDCSDTLRDVVTTLEPDVLITHGRDGVYGHRDHTALHRAVMDIAEHLPVGRVLTTEFPAHHFRPVWSALRSTNALDPLVTRDGLGIERSAADLVMHVNHVRERKIASVSAHASQLPGGDPLAFLKPGVLDPLLDEEWFCVARGEIDPHATTPLAGL